MACGSTLSQCHSAKLCKETSEDISVKMKRRARKSYGLEVNFEVCLVLGLRVINMTICLCSHLNIPNLLTITSSKKTFYYW